MSCPYLHLLSFVGLFLSIQFLFLLVRFLFLSVCFLLFLVCSLLSLLFSLPFHPLTIVFLFFSLINAVPFSFLLSSEGV